MAAACNFDVKYFIRISSYKNDGREGGALTGAPRQIGITSVTERSNKFCPGFVNIASYAFARSTRRQLVHNIQKRTLSLPPAFCSLIAIYIVPAVRIFLSISDGIHFALHTLGSSVL